MSDKTGYPMGDANMLSSLTMIVTGLDLFPAATMPKTSTLWHLKTTKMMPESFEYARNGGRKFGFAT